MKQQKQNSKGEQDAVMEVASVVINNQATAEENAISRGEVAAQGAARNKAYLMWQSYAVMGLLLCMFFGGSENARLNSENARLSMVIQQVELERSALNNDGVKAEHVWQIVDEQKLLIADLNTRINWKKETNLALVGFLTNDSRKLELATTVNPDRENGFPFVEWHPDITQNMLEFAINAFHIEALEWVVEQPEWYRIVNIDLVDRINSIIKDYSVTKRVGARRKATD